MGRNMKGRGYQYHPARVILDRQVGKITDQELWTTLAWMENAAARRICAILGLAPFTWPLTLVDMQIVGVELTPVFEKAGIPSGGTALALPDETRLAEYLRGLKILLDERDFIPREALPFAAFRLKCRMRINLEWLKRTAWVETEVTA